MTAPSTSANAYLRTKVLSAPPEELRLMLLDGAVRFCRQGRDGIASKNWEASFNGFSKCRNIIMELMTSMRPEIDPDLCARLMGLYTYLYNQIIEAAHEKSVEKADKVITLLEYERETWVMLIEKLKSERASFDQGRAAAREAVADAAPALGAKQAYRPVSVQG